MLKHMVVSIKMLLVLTVLTGVIYPLAVTGMAQAVFHYQANGSLIAKDGKVIGSELIGQYFDDPKYFWGRPSATAPAYNASASSGSNLGPTNKALLEAVEGRIKALRAADPGNAASVPADLVMASGSGLDPHISVAAVRYQIGRIAHLRKLSPKALNQLAGHFVERRPWGILGQPRVNVLKLNMALDRYKAGDITK